MNLQEYFDNPMQAPRGLNANSFPVKNEVNVRYSRAVVDSDSVSALDEVGSKLPQVWIPIQEESSTKEAYKKVVF